MDSANTPYKKLWRSRINKKIAGVCGGIGEYYNVDPIWIRIIFIVFFLAGGAAFIVYVILWLLIPLEPIDKEKNMIQTQNDDH